MTNSRANSDVLIVGGGMVGASLALQLDHYSGGSLNINVVETHAFAKGTYQPSFDARSSALSYGSRLIFEKLGLWAELSQQSSAIETIHVSERQRPGSAWIDCEEMDLPALGYVVDNAWLGRVLLDEVAKRSSIQWLCPATVTDIACQKQGVTVTVEQEGQQLQFNSQLLVVADGAQSSLRTKLGVQVHQQDYQQTAIIANVSFSQSHNHTAYERFTDWGPMALLPLSDDDQGQARAALVWTMSEQQAGHCCSISKTEFLDQLQQRFGHRQGKFLRVGERHRYPLGLIEAAEQVRSHVVLMGNAAHSLHPVAGQGFNLALRDCARLTELLVDAAAQGERLGELSLLQRYANRQQRDQFQTIRFSDQLTKLFTRYQNPFSLVRNIGLSGLDVMPMVKHQFVKLTAGISDGAAVGGLR